MWEIIVWGFKVWQFLVNLTSQVGIITIKLLQVFLHKHRHAVSRPPPSNARISLQARSHPCMHTKENIPKMLNNCKHKLRGEASEHPGCLPAWLEDPLFLFGFCPADLLCFILTLRKNQETRVWHVSNQHSNPVTYCLLICCAFDPWRVWNRFEPN